MGRNPSEDECLTASFEISYLKDHLIVSKSHFDEQTVTLTFLFLITMYPWPL